MRWVAHPRLHQEIVHRTISHLWYDNHKTTSKSIRLHYLDHFLISRIGLSVYACCGKWVSSLALGSAGTAIRIISYGIAITGLIIGAMIPCTLQHKSIRPHSEEQPSSHREPNTHWVYSPDSWNFVSPGSCPREFDKSWQISCRTFRYYRSASSRTRGIGFPVCIKHRHSSFIVLSDIGPLYALVAKVWTNDQIFEALGAWKKNKTK